MVEKKNTNKMKYFNITINPHEIVEKRDQNDAIDLEASNSNHRAIVRNDTISLCTTVYNCQM